MATPHNLNYLTILLLLSLHYNTTPAKEINLKSAVTKVTVYTDRALITRTAKENIVTGVNSLIINHLPATLIDQSLRISGLSEKTVKITDIKIEQKYLDTIPEIRISELNNRLRNLQTEKNALERKSNLLKSQLGVIDALRDNYSKSLTGPNPTQKASIEEWDKLLLFIEKKKTDYSEKIESIKQKIDSKQEKIKALETEIQNTTQYSTKEEKQVIITIDALQSCPIQIEISYLISEASWTPIYEARINSSDKTLQLFYSGLVRQSSGEDWNNISLTLSTAKPAISSKKPNIFPWYIDITTPAISRTGYPSRKKISISQPLSERTTFSNSITGKVLDADSNEPLVGANIVLTGTSLGCSTNIDGYYAIYNIPEGNYSLSISFIGYKREVIHNIRISKSYGVRQNIYLQPLAIESEEVVVMAQTKSSEESALSQYNVIEQVESVTSTELTSSNFKISSKQSISSDNQNHKVGISFEDIPIDFSYDVVPKIVQSAYLTGKGINAKDYPLLAGQVSVFIDNSFVTSTHLKTIMPNDSFNINLGIDEALSVERKLINKFTETVGTFSKKIRLTYEFELKIESHKNYPIEVKLSDQIPISRNEIIVVKQIEPDPSTFRPNSDGIFNWYLMLSAKEKRTINIKFAVEHPSYVFPYGLK